VITKTKRAETPANSQMTITHDAPVDFSGNPLDASLPTLVQVAPTVNGHYGATTATPGRLSRAGCVAMLAALNTYISGLSAAQLDQIHAVLGGLEVHVTPRSVSCPAAAGGAGTLAASIATVLSTGGNVVNLTP
jgi:hypothetical protein